MPARRAPIRAVLAAGLLLAIAGCGLDDDDQKAADNLEPALVGNGTEDAERDAAECVAETWVGEVGTDALVDAKLLTTDLDARRQAVREVLAGKRAVPRKVAAGLAEARLECADFDAIALDRKADHPKATAEELDEYADCLKEVDRDDWERSITAFYTGTKASGLGGFRDDLKACDAMLEATRR